ncbi:YtcA family lipoprotein [Chachezhania sediminis]|uniref:YtcA family lipoprotein n=1 Tax=Chachezhania sediminis TaxID=2599291 RepID=UPI0018EF2A34|nr:YtcA family lipoprotein [Chachezhania sediminis]
MTLPLFLTAGYAAAPSLALFGSYFPAWLISLGAAIVLTVLIRVVFVLTRVDDILRWRVPAYFALALALTYLILSLFFGR